MRLYFQWLLHFLIFFNNKWVLLSSGSKIRCELGSQKIFLDLLWVVGLTNFGLPFIEGVFDVDLSFHLANIMTIVAAVIRSEDWLLIIVASNWVWRLLPLVESHYRFLDCLQLFRVLYWFTRGLDICEICSPVGTASGLKDQFVCQFWGS
jgi:hypothetical protein